MSWRRSRLPLRPLARKSLADVTRRKGRTILVVMGILIGVLGLTAINVAAGAMGEAFAFSNDQHHTGNIEFDVSRVDARTAAALQGLDNVQAVQLLTFYNTQWHVSAAPGHVAINILSYPDLSHITLNGFQLTSGHLPGAGEIVMEDSNRTLQRFATGDRVTVEGPTGTPQTLTVSGVARTVGRTSAGFAGVARGYMDAAALAALSGVDAPNTIEMQLRDTAHATQTAQAARALLTASGTTINGSAIITDQLSLGPLAGLFAVMRVLSLVALLLTSFLIINTITTLVAEQTGIIGTMKALGATGWTVMRGYLSSVALYAVAGTVLGIALGIYAGYAIAQYLTGIIVLDLGPFTLDRGVIALSAAVGLGVPLLAALAPLWSGTRITVREALAGYGLGAGTAARAQRRRVSHRSAGGPAAAVGTRGIFRRPVRAALTLLALTLSATAFLAIQTTTYSANQFISHIFSQYDFDAFVSIKPQPWKQAQTRLLAVPNVGVVERFEQQELRTKWGNLRVQATDPDTTLYHYDMLRGTWFGGEAPGAIILSEQASQQAGLGVGNTITVTGATNTATWRIIGIARDQNGGLGTIGTGFVTISTLHSFTGVPADQASVFMLRAVNRSPAAVNQLATALDRTLRADGLSPFISTAQQQIAQNQQEFGILYALLNAVAAIVALVGLLGLFNTLTTSVLERRREIGILRSMGATGWRVAGIFWTEGLALAGIAWLVAVALGIPAAYAFVALISNVLIQIPFAFSPLALATMLVFTLVVATLASIIPAASAARVRVVDTLRYE
ncbi:MAG: FtsX-like permease family protein [Ktedonobacterales bacterium]